ncbi:ATPase, T2SS/T4P/T4SS family [Neisseria leonii]|nr:ATPase, T2SS/T4P/T4SS family [Neisseria sp. 3986]MDD9324808.1 ATPase, T2SS/T4P/T4SS family [Neisseria sp. 3986]
MNRAVRRQAVCFGAAEPENGLAEGGGMASGALRILAGHFGWDGTVLRRCEEWARQGLLLPKLFEEGLCTPDEVAAVLAQAVGRPYVDLAAFAPEDTAMTAEQMRRFGCVPLARRQGRLLAGVADPTDPVLQRLAFVCAEPVDLAVVRYDLLVQRLAESGGGTAGILAQMPQEEAGTAAAWAEEAGDGPVARFVQQVLEDAWAAGASDVHFEFYEQAARVRFRVDGVLREVVQPPHAVRRRLVSRIKVMAGLDIAEQRLPQDGRLQTVLGGRTADLRISTLPTLFGEKVVVRILNGDAQAPDLARLGLEPCQYDLLLAEIRRPYGMILVTGPTGSGKTLSLYACLNELNSERVNIAAVEDPAEINLAGINQVNVNEKQGLTFAEALRAFLRQDPDVLMVGEIRDLETADIAVKAAQTGHLVFSTLHTNRAAASLTRLLNMGVAPFHIAASVNLVVAQRLVRKLCPHCREVWERPSENVLAAAGFTPQDLAQDWPLYRPKGCAACRGKGYRGRIGIFELMPVSQAMRRAMMDGAGELDLAALAAREGMVDLRRAGLLKVMAGATTLAEVDAVVGR